MLIIYHSALSNDEICDTLDTLSPLDISIASIIESAASNIILNRGDKGSETTHRELWIQHVLSQFLRTKLCTGLTDYDRLYCLLTKQYTALLSDLRAMIPYIQFTPDKIRLKCIDRQVMIFEVT
jgi:hypothetical protein